MQFSSSRTLPGQRCASISKASSVKWACAGPFLHGEALCEGMREMGRVAVTLAQGGISMTISASRWYRSRGRPRPGSALEVAMGGTPRCGRRPGSRPPMRSIERSCRKRSSGLQRERQVADLVEEEGTAVGRLDLAEGLFHCAGEGALLVAEQLALKQASGMAAQLIATKRSRHGRAHVQSARGISAGTALAEQARPWRRPRRASRSCGRP